MIDCDVMHSNDLFFFFISKTKPMMDANEHEKNTNFEDYCEGLTRDELEQKIRERLSSESGESFKVSIVDV